MKNNYHKILESLPIWQGRLIFNKFSDKGGQTNINFFVKDDRGEYVAHFAPETWKLLGLNKKREIFNTKIASSLGIGPEFIGYFPRYHLIIIKYLSGRVIFPPAKMRPAQIKLIAKMLKSLHGGPKFQGQFNPFAVGRKHVAMAKKFKVWLPKDVDKILYILNNLEKKFGNYNLTSPCHVDLVMENLVWTKNGVKLIDWEYSANSDYRYDLAMVSNRWNFSQRDDKFLIKEYGGGKDVLNKIQLLKPVVCFREAAWALLQQAISKKNINYKKYAKDNFNQFRKLAGKII